MRCLATTLAVEIVKSTPNASENETGAWGPYISASMSASTIERTINTDAHVASRAAVLLPQSCRSIMLVNRPASTPSKLAGKTYSTRTNQRIITGPKGKIISYLPVQNSATLERKFSHIAFSSAKSANIVGRRFRDCTGSSDVEGNDTLSRLRGCCLSQSGHCEGMS
jgi:hypothetical protein